MIFLVNNSAQKTASGKAWHFMFKPNQKKKHKLKVYSKLRTKTNRPIYFADACKIHA
jgi:hypothetical protein